MVFGPTTEVTSLLNFMPRAVAGGLLGTIVFTLMMKLLAPMMIGHPMDIGVVLGVFTGLGASAGVIMHFLLGSLGFAVGFLIVGPSLTGPGWLRGATFMVGVWFVAGLVAMPMLGVGLFFGGVKEAVVALLGHAVLGAVLGTIARLPSRRASETPS
jgi:hypothetical protein